MSPLYSVFGETVDVASVGVSVRNIAKPDLYPFPAGRYSTQ